MDLWLLVFGVLCVSLVFFYFKFRAVAIAGAKSPPTVPFFGVALGMEVATYFEWESAQFAKYGKSWSLSLPGSPPTLNTIDPVVIKTILQDEFNNFEKGEPFDFVFRDLLGDGIFNADGEKWRKQRKAASHLFTYRVLRETMGPVFSSHLQTLVELLFLKAHPPVPIAAQRLMFGFTLDCFSQIAFGVTLNETEAAIENTPQAEGFGFHFDRAQEIIAWRFFAPYWNILKKLNIGGERQLKGHLKFIRAFCENLVRQRCLTEENGEKRDLLQLFREAKDENNQNYTPEWLTTMLINFLVAGRDTTACLLSWALWRMALPENAGLLHKLRGEIDHAMLQVEVIEDAHVVPFSALEHIPLSYQTLHAWLPHETLKRDKYANLWLLNTLVDPGRKSLNLQHRVSSGTSWNGWSERPRRASYEGQHNAPVDRTFLRIVMEVLRLHPSVPSDGKTARNSCTLPNGLTIPAGGSVFYSMYANARSEELWGADAAEFKPERWQEFQNEDPDNGEKAKLSNFQFPHFNAGPRLCLGKQMAIHEARMALCTLLRHFTPTLAPGLTFLPMFPGQLEPAYKMGVTLQMKDELMLTFPVRPRH